MVSNLDGKPQGRTHESRTKHVDQTAECLGGLQQGFHAVLVMLQSAELANVTGRSSGAGVTGDGQITWHSPQDANARNEFNPPSLALQPSPQIAVRPSRSLNLGRLGYARGLRGTDRRLD